MCFPVEDLCDTSLLTRRLDALQTSLVKKRSLSLSFFNGHFCFLATGKFYTNLYPPSYGNRSTHVLFMAPELSKEKGERRPEKSLSCCFDPASWFKLYGPDSTFLGL